MFALPFNFPFRKSDGSLSTIGDEISAGGGGGGYTLPTASANTKGGVKIGSGLTMEGEVLNNDNPTPYTLPTASTETKGGIKIGSGLTMEGEILNNDNPTPYTLPTASTETKGGIKIGSGLSLNGEILNNTTGNYDSTITLTNVSESELKAFKTNDIVTMGGVVELTNDLSIGSNVSISSGGVPANLRVGFYCPNIVIATDENASEFVPVILVTYPNGNINIYNTLADIAIKYIWVNCSYRIGVI